MDYCRRSLIEGMDQWSGLVIEGNGTWEKVGWCLGHSEEGAELMAAALVTRGATGKFGWRPANDPELYGADSDNGGVGCVDWVAG